MTFLLTIKGFNTGLKFSLQDYTKIGRSEENDICIPDASVSRFHAEIRKKQLHYVIYDLESKNGVIVNGKIVKESVLLKNDEIKIGTTVFLYDSDLNLHNAVFGNKSLLIMPSEDETIRTQYLESSADLSEDEKSALSVIQNISDLFSPDFSKSFNEILCEIISQIIKIFRAERGAILLYDEILKELRPMIIKGDNDNMVISSKVIYECFRERKSLLISGRNTYNCSKIISDDSESTSGSKEIFTSTISAPMVIDKKCIGVIILEKDTIDYFSLKDLRIFQSLGFLFSYAVLQAEQNDKLRNIMETTSEQSKQIIGNSPKIKDAFSMIDKVAAHDTTVIITGETGTGKELFAKEIHNRSHRRDNLFIAVNCSSIPKELFESEFFGYEKGSFTGAVKLTIGKIEAAHGGTLFLDEIGDMPADLQPKLLRFLQDKAFYRVGGTKPVRADVRIITATNKNIDEEIKKGTFREDLWFRLSIMQINLPPLRERKSDIKLLAEHFLQRFSKEFKKNILGFTDNALILLEKQEWKGNVRELSNCIERAVLMTDKKILDASELIFSAYALKENNADLILSENLNKEKTIKDFSDLLNLFKMDENNFSLRDAEKFIIKYALEKCEHNQIKASKLLNIHRNTLANKIKEYDL